MSKEVTKNEIFQELKSLATGVEGIGVEINGIKGEIKGIKNEIKEMKIDIKDTKSNLTDLTIITKMGFDETGIKVDQNTHAISDLNHRVTENSDRLTRVEINMNQEFAAATRQRRRILENVDNHQGRLCTLESQS